MLHNISTFSPSLHTSRASFFWLGNDERQSDRRYWLAGV